MYNDILKSRILSCYSNADDLIKGGVHKQHKYIRKEGDKYIYEESEKKVDETVGNIKKDTTFTSSNKQSMKAQLKKFLLSLKESDFRGSETDPKLKEQAEKFLNSGAYKPYESYKKKDLDGDEGTYDVHETLLCLLYEEV